MTPTSRPTLRDLRRHIRSLTDKRRAVLLRRFFKTGPGQYGEGDQFLGITVPQLRKLVRPFGALRLSELRRLLASRWHEERLLALMILVDRYGRGDRTEQKAIYDVYLRSTRHINSWDLVDASAGQIVGSYLAPRKRAPLFRLARSRNVWERRMAIIATFHFIKRGEFADCLALAVVFLDDRHDLIHKAVGWMLREVGKRERDTELRFLDQYAARMPRTMLRYAIERFPLRLRRKYLRAEPVTSRGRGHTTSSRPRNTRTIRPPGRVGR